jgi:hypothetical protein
MRTISSGERAFAPIRLKSRACGDFATGCSVKMASRIYGRVLKRQTGSLVSCSEDGANFKWSVLVDDFRTFQG